MPYQDYETHLESLEFSLEEIQRDVDALSLENQLFKRYLTRNSSSSSSPPQSASVGVGEDKKNLKHRRNKIPHVLTLPQKLQIITSELESLTLDRTNSKNSSSKLIDTLRAVLEETDLRIVELKKDAYEFKRDIVVGAENPRTGVTASEKVVRYMDNKLRERDGMIDKLRLKNDTLKSLKIKTENMLKVKEETGDVLHYIDFHQLQIENKQYISKIEERNDQLIKLKLTTGVTIHKLNSLKSGLVSLLEEERGLREEIDSKEGIIKKVMSDIQAVEGSLKAENYAKKSLADPEQAYEGDNSSSGSGGSMPSILEYVKQKGEEFEMRAKVKEWERKVEIAEMEGKRIRGFRRREGEGRK